MQRQTDKSTAWYNDGFLMRALTDRYRMKFSFFQARPYVHIRDLGENGTVTDSSTHTYVTLTRDAIFKLQDELPTFTSILTEYDAQKEPNLLFHENHSEDSSGDEELQPELLKWNKSGYLAKPITSRYRIKFSLIEDQPYIQIRDLGKWGSEEDVSTHRFVNLTKGAAFKLQEKIPTFTDCLLVFDEIGSPKCLKSTRGEKRSLSKDRSDMSGKEPSKTHKTKKNKKN